MNKNTIKYAKAIIRHPIQTLFLNQIYKKLNQIEYRQFNRRFYAIDQITEYLIGADISGDYLEFGVFQGRTFTYANQFMSPHFKDMRFIAFDSFEGLPNPMGIDALNGYTSRFYEKEFSCSEKSFIDNIKSQGVDLNRVITVPGWFNETLDQKTATELELNSISAAWIDCDLYESTVPVLKFITRHLQTGSVIAFDDWRCFRNHPNFGEQKACREWLSQNPNISLNELFSFGWNGIVFTVDVK